MTITFNFITAVFSATKKYVKKKNNYELKKVKWLHGAECSIMISLHGAIVELAV